MKQNETGWKEKTAEDLLFKYNQGLLTRTEFVCFLAARPDEEIKSLNIGKRIKNDAIKLKEIGQDHIIVGGTQKGQDHC